MTNKLLAGVSALVLALAMSHTAIAGSASDNSADGDGNDTVTATDNDQFLSGNVNNKNRNDTNILGNSALNGNVVDSNNTLNESTNITVGNVRLAVSLQSLTQSNTGQSFSDELIEDQGEIDMDVEIEDNVGRYAAGVVQIAAQSGFQPQAQQASSIAVVGTVNLAGGGNTGPAIVAPGAP